jgi:uncharacterized protein YndB with AHSA1/START domain
MGMNKDPRTKAERKSDREMITTRSFNAPPRIVYKAWSDPALFQRWWLGKSMGLTMISCQMDIRTGGSYKVEISQGGGKPMPFFGHYTEVLPEKKIVWTNEESGEITVTTVTFEEQDGRTLLALHELYPNKESLDAVFNGMDGAMIEPFEQLDALLPELGA